MRIRVALGQVQKIRKAGERTSWSRKRSGHVSTQCPSKILSVMNKRQDQRTPKFAQSLHFPHVGIRNEVASAKRAVGESRTEMKTQRPVHFERVWNMSKGR